MTYVMTYIWLLFAHFLGDWGICNPWIAEAKGKHWEVMTAHCMIWTGCVCVVLEYMGIMALWKVIMLFVGHYTVDKWKCNYATTENFPTWHLYVDQVLHFGQLAVVGVF